LQAQRALQAELAVSAPQIRAMPAPRPTVRRRMAVMATAAAVIVAALGIRWGMKPNSPPPAPSTRSIQPGPAFPSLAELALFDPPTYTPTVLRGAQDEATRTFRAAMKHYQNGDYARAIAGLRQASKLNPKDSGPLFFIGVSHLLSGQTDVGIAVLQQCVALGDTPYLEGAHYYLGKAFLQKKDLSAAEAELRKTVQLKGDLEKKAEELLQAIQALPQRVH
jgi:TolA-binding protein